MDLSIFIESLTLSELTQVTHSFWSIVIFTVEIGKNLFLHHFFDSFH